MTVRVAVVTDTTACIPKDKLEEYSIELVPIGLIFGDTVYRDGIDITPARFYEMLRQADKLPTTSGSQTAPYLEAYRRAGRRAKNIACITESSNFSGMYNSALLAVEMAKEALPGVKIEVLECSSAAAGQGLITLAAARVATSGKSLDEVLQAARELMPRVHLFATLDTLYYLARGGRVPQVAALVNSILKLKPVFSVNGGEAHTVALPRSNAKALKHILRVMKKMIGERQPVHVAVMHADAPERAMEFKKQIASRFNCVELFVTEFTPVMGVHTGPGLVGAAYYSEV